MTQYSIKHQGYDIRVGWNAQMDTYFATVDDGNDFGAAWPLTWLGSLPGEYRVFEIFYRDFLRQLESIGIKDFALSEEQIGQLKADYVRHLLGSSTARQNPAIIDLRRQLNDGHS